MPNTDDKKTVLHIASVFPSNSNRLALQCQYSRGERCVHLLQIRANEKANDPAWKLVHTKILPHWPRHRPGSAYLLRRARSLIRRLINSISLHVHLLRSQADLLHAHEHSSLWPLAFWVLVLRRPAIWDPHDFFHESGDLRQLSKTVRFRSFLERAIVRRGTPIIAVSAGMRKKYAALYPNATVMVLRNYSSQRTKLVESADQIDACAGQLVAQRRRSGEMCLRLVYPGLIKPERFSLDLIRAIGAVDGVTLDIYGEDRSTTGVNRSNLARTLSEHNICNVFLKGAYTSDSIVKILSRYHFVLLPYRVTHPNIDFCLPNKFYQCIEAGLPMITSNMKEMGGIIRNHSLGYVFPADNDLACIKVIENCRNLGEEYLQLVRNLLSYQLAEIGYSQQRSLLLDAYSAAAQLRRS